MQRCKYVSLIIAMLLLGLSVSVEAQTKKEFLNEIRSAGEKLNLPMGQGEDGFGGEVLWTHFYAVDEGSSGNSEIVFGYKFTGMTLDELSSGVKNELRSSILGTLKEEIKALGPNIKKYNVGCRVWFQNQKGKQVVSLFFPASEIY